MQHGSTGDHHFELGTAREQRCHLNGSLNHLLKVVQQQQQLFLSQRFAQEVKQRLTGSLFEAERLSNGGHDQLRITDGGQAHEKDAIREVIEQVSRHLQPQAGFADAASTGKGQQVHIWTLQERTRSRHLPSAPNQ